MLSQSYHPTKHFVTVQNHESHKGTSIALRSKSMQIRLLDEGLRTE